jgi:carbonic anhydrase
MLKELLDNNRNWAARQKEKDPDFFRGLCEQQSPKYLWIGCSDSRVPANEIVGMQPGEIFVHRNVANLVYHNDMNCLSVIQYSVEILRVKHIIVCGHYGCGGIEAAMSHANHGLVDNWLRSIKDIYRHNSKHFEAGITEGMTEKEQLNLLCELNVLEQVGNVCHTSIVQEAWNRGQELSVHAWIYGLEDGVIKDLHVDITGIEQIPDIYRMQP